MPRSMFDILNRLLLDQDRNFNWGETKRNHRNEIWNKRGRTILYSQLKYWWKQSWCRPLYITVPVTHHSLSLSCHTPLSVSLCHTPLPVTHHTHTPCHSPHSHSLSLTTLTLTVTHHTHTPCPLTTLTLPVTHHTHTPCHSPHSHSLSLTTLTLPVTHHIHTLYHSPHLHSLSLTTLTLPVTHHTHTPCHSPHSHSVSLTTLTLPVTHSPLSYNPHTNITHTG